MLFDSLGKFCRNISGNFAVTFSILAVPILGAVGIAVDYSAMYSAKTSLQDVADGASLAAVKELTISTTTDTEIASIAKSYVSTQFNVEQTSSDYVEVSTITANDRSSVTVNLAYYWTPFLAQFLDYRMTPIRVNAVAVRAGSEAACVIVLQPDSQERLLFTGNASIVANNCAVHVASNDPAAIDLDKQAVLKASNIYSGGGYIGQAVSFSPQPIPDAPTIPDPLAGRSPPSSGACTATDLVVNEGAIATLYPGTYCGGLSVSKGGKVFFKPGVYVMKDGPLWSVGITELVGENVGFYFEGDKAVFDIGLDTYVSLTAPKSGPLAGILAFEDRNAPLNRKFTMRSKNAERMEGVIYLPNGELFVDKASRIGQASKWTAIVARRVVIGNGPQIQINSNYGGSSIPAPPGITGTGDEVYLAN